MAWKIFRKKNVGNNDDKNTEAGPRRLVVKSAGDLNAVKGGANHETKKSGAMSRISKTMSSRLSAARLSGETSQAAGLAGKFIGSIDQGTTSTRFIIFNHNGEKVASAQKEHTQIFPAEGFVEHDPVEILNNTKECISAALKEAKLPASALAGVGITNQRETTVVWDKTTGIPYCNAVVWMDMRSQALCHELSNESKELGKDRFRELTGLPISPYFSGTKLRWLMENVPAVAEGARSGNALFGTIDSWLLWNLSSGEHHITDVTNASRTLLMNINTLEWDEELIKAIGVPRSMLPNIRSNSEVYFKASIKELKGVPISGVLGDQQAALFGQACYNVGDAKNTYGTGCFLLLNTGEKAVQSTNGLLTTVAYKLGNQPATYALEGSVAMGGATVQWLRDNINLIADAKEVETLANKVTDNGGMYFVPAFSGLYAPYWRDDARGVIVGLTRFSNKNHLARATVEAIAFQSYDVFRAMQEDSGIKLNELRVDGGAVANATLMQFQADLLDIPVIRPRDLETTALGAAYAAGLAVGYWSSMDELRERWNTSKTWQPAMESKQRKKLKKGWAKAVKRTLNWVDDDEDDDEEEEGVKAPVGVSKL